MKFEDIRTEKKTLSLALSLEKKEFLTTVCSEVELDFLGLVACMANWPDKQTKINEIFESKDNLEVISWLQDRKLIPQKPIRDNSEVVTLYELIMNYD
ncbi:hypothetical protein BpHYR1_043389 [Brachionus plicatilis]|uniref:Uncharacterized protein n=1 Tax=Brachionus plicatilis TaxID=10195 RepID=A0A3M7QVQ7_BRAPC|nr:hypothetical protein BpHYR1_043389 [Brachionus plicatilis]